LDSVLGLKHPPLWHRRIVWPEAIPQYDINHQIFLKTYLAGNWEKKGLILAGSFCGGISVPDCIESGLRAAQKIDIG
jgi:oxygen-dependent protoporphyrinogen oxidase